MSNHKWDHLPWDTIREAYVCGVPAGQLQEKYGVPEGTIRGRAHRQNWPSPHRVRKVMQEAHKLIEEEPEKGEDLMDKLGSQVKGIDPNGSMREIVSSLEARQKKHQDLMVNMLQKSLDKAKIKPPKDYRELDIADKIMRRNLDLDKKDDKPSVQIGIIGGQVEEIGSQE